MPVLPALRPLFERIGAMGGGRPPVGLSSAELRDLAHAGLENNITCFYANEALLPREQDYAVRVDGGAITVRVYAPDDAAPLPCHVYLHGGGFWLGRLDDFDPLCRGLAREAGCAVASVDYRLAPEHKFPTAAKDAYAALTWVRENAADLGLDAKRISIGGVSAGGNLAAVACLMARDRGAPAPVLQVLEVPVLDLENQNPLSVPELGLELPSGKDVYCAHYLSHPDEAAYADASPLLADDLSRLPGALIMCAQYDPLAPEGKAYAERLAASGVPVEYRLWEGQFHGAQPMARLIPAEAAAYQTVMATALRRAYGSD